MTRRTVSVALIGAVAASVACSSSPVQPLPANEAVRSRTGQPVVETLRPASGPVGTTVTVAGSGLLPDLNAVRFGPGFSWFHASTDGNTLSFVVPAHHDLCPPPEIGLTEPCLEAHPQVMPGAYRVTVVNRAGESGSVTFTVTEP